MDKVLNSIEFYKMERASFLKEDEFLDNSELIKKYKELVLIDSNSYEVDELKTKLFLNNLPFFTKVLFTKFNLAQNCLDDCLSYVMISFCKCLEKFDSEKNTAFSTFLYFYICQGVYMFFEENGYCLPIPRHVNNFICAYKKELVLNPLCTIEDFCSSYKSSCGKSISYNSAVSGLAVVNGIITSFDDSSSTDIESLLPYEHSFFDEGLTYDIFNIISNYLKPSEVELLKLRYNEDMTIKQIADIYGVSKQAISVKIINSLKKLKKKKELKLIK